MTLNKGLLQSSENWIKVRQAFAEWSSSPLDIRIKKLKRLRHEIVGRLEEIIAAVQQDAGKVRTEALLTDILPTLEILRFNEKNAGRLLCPEKRAGSLLFPGTCAHVIHKPYGVVLIVAPWNNPFQLTLLPAATALLAGNAVIIKPSEKTPGVASILRELFAAVNFPASLVEIVDGGPETVAELVNAGPDIIFFTGGLHGGKAVYRLAAEKMIPAIMELGGKDAMIVFADADLDRAAKAAVYGAFAHDGQHCVSVERVYVAENIVEPFLSRVVAHVAVLRRSAENGADLAATLDAKTAERIHGQIADALERGARLLTVAENDKALFPAVVADVPPDALLMRKESFGPVLAAASFADEAEVLRLANDCDFGLNASIWTRDSARARRVAQHLETGCVCINNVLVNAGHPALPFGGVKQSGFGRYHGPEGLLSFTCPKAILDQRRVGSGGLNLFPYDNELTEITEDLIRLRYGQKFGIGQKIRGWFTLASRRAARLRRVSSALEKIERLQR